MQGRPDGAHLNVHWPTSRSMKGRANIRLKNLSVSAVMGSLREGGPRGSGTSDGLGNLGEPWGRLGSIEES